MTIVFSLILTLYCLMLAVFLFGWVRIRRQSMPAKGTSMPGISIVVAARNEEENIESLMHDLAGIAYPIEKFEVIVVNDHSTDATAANVNLMIKELSNARLFDLDEGKKGKKEALRLGIREARFEIIVTTDADCHFSRNWLSCLSSYFEQEETKMLVGAVRLAGDHSLFSRMQIIEFVSLVGSTAAAIGLGYPIMCNGANLAFRKNVFKEVRGYEGNLRIASGDDEFLMRKIAHRYPGSIRFLNYYEAVVSSLPQKNIRNFYYQRLRWAGKWRHNSDPVAQFLAVFVFVSQLAFVGLLWNNLIAPDKTLGLVIGKLFLEGLFIYWVGRFLDRRFDILAFLTLQIIYPFYVTVIGVFSFFAPYGWKGRNYK